MKKLLSILGAVGITASSSFLVVSCGNKKSDLINDKTVISSEEIQNFIEKSGKVKNLKNIDEVKNKLEEESRNIEAVTSLTATLKGNSKTDVTVKVEIDTENYTLVGSPTFDILGAIKDYNKKDVDTKIIETKLKEDFQGLNSLDEFKNKLNNEVSQFEGVTSLEFKDFFNNLYTDLIVTVKINEDEYNLIGNSDILINNALSKISLKTDEIQEIASKTIFNLNGIDEVKNKLQKILETINSIHGITFIESVEAKIKENSKTDVTVTLTVNKKNVNLIGDSNFDILGAIKDNKINISLEDVKNIASDNIQNLSDLKAVNDKLSKNLKENNNIKGVTSLKADYKDNDVNSTDVTVTVTVDETNYNLVGGSTFDIQGAIFDKNSNKNQINSEDIQNQCKLVLRNLKDLDQVNAELNKIKSQFEGVTLLNADYAYIAGLPLDSLKIPGSVKVTIEINENSYYLKGDSVFQIDGAIEVKTSQPTIYIDENGNEVSTDAKNLSNIKSKEIKQIGFYTETTWFITTTCHAVQMPKTVEKVPNELPKEITSLDHMFNEAPLFNQDISNWDVSKVTDMSFMFSGAASFNQPIGKWNTSKVTDMNNMFSNATSFNQDISSWNTSKVTNMSAMFYGAASFNQNIQTRTEGWLFWKTYHWDVSKVTDMSFMFFDAASFNQDISNWNTSKVKKHADFDYNSNANWANNKKPTWTK